MSEGYLWYVLNPFAVSAGDKHDDVKDRDLLMLCKDIPDILFQIFKTPKEGTTITLRVPKSYANNITSVESFGSKLTNSDGASPGEYAVGMKIDTLTTLRLTGKSAYPIITDKNNVDRHIFSTFKDIPFGVFGLKLLHAPSKIISKQYDSIRKKNKIHEENLSKTDPYEKYAKLKSECTSFFYTEMFYGVQNIHDDDKYEKFIPYYSETRKPNSLVSRKRIALSDKCRSKASDAYEKIIHTKYKKTNMVLSDIDLLPFVRFSENPYSISHDSAQTPTTSNVSVLENDFDNIDAEFQ
jgi:hypothetical protein